LLLLVSLIKMIFVTQITVLLSSYIKRCSKFFTVTQPLHHKASCDAHLIFCRHLPLDFSLLSLIFGSNHTTFIRDV